jgi:hypothetical protein
MFNFIKFIFYFFSENYQYQKCIIFNLKSQMLTSFFFISSLTNKNFYKLKKKFDTKYLFQNNIVLIVLII